MRTIAHFTVTYPGASWLRSQINSIEQFRSITVSWARDCDDTVTQGERYFQLLPQPSLHPLWLKGILPAGLAAEQAGQLLTRRAHRIVQREGSQLIHAHFGRAGYYAIPLVRKASIPLITSFYGYDLSEYPTRYPAWRENYRRLFEQGTYFLVEGSYMRQTLIGLGCPPEKAIHQRLGIDLGKFPYEPRSWTSGSPLNVLQVARIREKKGIPDSVRAFARLVQQVPDAHFTLIGDINSAFAKPIMAEVQQIVADEGIAASVQFLDEVPYDEYARILKDAHIFIQPSVVASNGDTEGGAPVSLIEAAASGMLIVATRHCDIPEVVLDGQSGLLADEHDAEGLAARLIHLAEHPDQWAAMTETGRKHIESDYDLRRQIGLLEAIYERALA